MRRFVFLDRDGTLIVQKPYLSQVDGVELIPGAAQGLRELQERGFGLAVITNQSGVNRGLFDLARVAEVHARMEELLAEAGVRLDAIHVCPHRPDEGCACRKPATGMIDAVMRDHPVDRNASFMIGDKVCDLDCARNAGLKPVLVRTGYGAELEAGIGGRADFIADDLRDAAAWILGR